MCEFRKTAGNHVLALVEGDVLLGKLLLQGVDVLFESEVLDLEALGFLTLTFPGVVCSGAVALDAFDTTLLLLIGRLGPLTGRQVGLWFRECLTP